MKKIFFFRSGRVSFSELNRYFFHEGGESYS
nr:MAG TPA: hypothetical protein [Caudoviricetes sp.]